MKIIKLTQKEIAKGKIAEKKVIQLFGKTGFYKIRRSNKSYNPYDFVAVSKMGEKFYIQVKSGKNWCSNEEKEKLAAIAKKRKGQAMCIKYLGNGKTKAKYIYPKNKEIIEYGESK